jgi:2-oxoglutarate/2-oxoacid ferredoxin oxidoreductase subunit alpha
MSTRIPQSGGTFVQMEDELGSINAIIGARWGGKKAMTATSGPGFSLMQEGVGYGIVTETPIVIVDVQRGGPSTGQPTSSSQQDIYQAKYGSHGDYEIIAYAPSSVQEMFDFTIKAFNQAEKYRVPVIILADEIVGHMRERILIPEEIEIELKESPATVCNAPFQTDESLIPPAVEFFQGHNLIIDGQLHDERGLRAAHLVDVSEKLVQRLSNKILQHLEEITDIENYQTEDASLIVIAYGSVARPSLEALKQARSAGLPVGLIKINTVWPFPEKSLQKLTSKASSIIVPEMNMGKYCREIRGALRDKDVISMPLVGGNIHKPVEIYNKMREVLDNARLS